MAAHGNLTDQLAHFASTARFEDLPEAVVRETGRLLLDTIGCALGAIHTPSGQVALTYAGVVGGSPAATVLGGERSSALTAAYVNARLANVLDADDTFPTATHFGNAGVFSALALCEMFGRSGRELAASIAIGFEVGARIGSWMGVPIQVRDGKVVGFNDVAGPAAAVTWSAVGAAVAAARLSAGQTHHAFGIAGANAPLPTMHKFIEQTEISMYKYADAGWCAQIGVSAALQAGLGSTGMANILDGPNGFWRLYGSPGHDDAALLDGLGSDWQILNTTYKAWPCCRFIHYPMTAFVSLKAKHGLRAEEIERVVVRASPFALSAIFHDKHPANPLSAEFSHAHSLAVQAFDIPPGPLWMHAETLDDPAIRAFREKVDATLEPSCANMADHIEGGQWRRIPGGVDVHARGQVFSATSEMARGDPWSDASRMSDDDLAAKFRDMVGLHALEGAEARNVRGLADDVMGAIAEIGRIELAQLTRPLSELASSVRAPIPRSWAAA
jgi:2-methylcitrate dehydratase PrpD